jgi:hypothetical protein
MHFINDSHTSYRLTDLLHAHNTMTFALTASFILQWQNTYTHIKYLIQEHIQTSIQNKNFKNHD